MSETLEEIQANYEEAAIEAGDLDAIERRDRRIAAAERLEWEARTRESAKHMSGELSKYLSTSLCVDTETHVNTDDRGVITANFYATEQMSTIVLDELKRLEKDNGYKMELEVCPPSPAVFINRRNGYYATFTPDKEAISAIYEAKPSEGGVQEEEEGPGGCEGV